MQTRETNGIKVSLPAVGATEVLTKNGAFLRQVTLRRIYRERFKKRIMPRTSVEFESGFAVAETAQLQEVGRCRRAQIQRLLDAGRTDF
jgi:hypothetical protein